MMIRNPEEENNWNFLMLTIYFNIAKIEDMFRKVFYIILIIKARRNIFFE